jgi:hypothetical protein
MAQPRARASHDDEDYRPPSAPRIQDVASRAGVAIGTVSNVLNNPDLVTEQTRLKVEAAIAESWVSSGTALLGRLQRDGRIPSG